MLWNPDSADIGSGTWPPPPLSQDTDPFVSSFSGLSCHHASLVQHTHPGSAFSVWILVAKTNGRKCGASGKHVNKHSLSQVSTALGRPISCSLKEILNHWPEEQLLAGAASWDLGLWDMTPGQAPRENFRMLGNLVEPMRGVTGSGGEGESGV